MAPYIALYRYRAADLGPIKRFYTSGTEEATNLQWLINEETLDGLPLYEALKAF